MIDIGNECILVCILSSLSSVHSRKDKLEMPGNKSGSCKWNNEYSKSYPGITSAKNGKKDYCHCTHCGKDLSIHHKGRVDIEKHLKTKEHITNCKKVAGTQTLDKLFNGMIVKFSVFLSSFFPIIF